MPMFQTAPRFMIFFSGYVMFICIGASVFLAIEQEVELQHIEHIKELKGDFLRRNPCVHYGDLQTLIEIFEVSNKKGLTTSDNFTRWSFGQSLFFASTIVTTIGYGHITPASKSGKIFTILFALIGIPLTLSVLSALVDRLLFPTHALLHWLNKKLGDTYQVFKIKLLHLIIILSVAIIFFLLIPAMCYDYLEPDWEYLDAVYYCFLSLTTIGFGDFTPGDSHVFFEHHDGVRFIYKLGTTIYLFLGVTYMMLTLGVFYSIPQLNLGDLYISESHMPSITSMEEEDLPTTVEVIREPSQTKKEVTIAVPKK